MSILVMSLVWSHGPEAPHQRLMMLAIADNANDRGVAWPSVATLAAKCSVQERAAQYTLQTLQHEGWLAIEERPGRSNYYRVNLARLRDAVDCTPAMDCTTGGAVDSTPGVQPVAPEPSLNHQSEPSSLVRPSAGRARAEYTLTFEEFWAIYPRKESKQAAARAWRKAVTRAPWREIQDAAMRYADDPNREPAFTKHAATWLNSDGWLDAALPARARTVTAQSAYDRTMALANSLANGTAQIGAGS